MAWYGSLLLCSRLQHCCRVVPANKGSAALWLCEGTWILVSKQLFQPSETSGGQFCMIQRTLLFVT